MPGIGGRGPQQIATKPCISGYSGHLPTIAAAAHATLVLLFQELDQQQDFGRETIVRIQNVRGTGCGHFGDENELVCLADRDEHGTAHSGTRELSSIDAEGLGRIAVNSHVARNVLGDLRLTGDKALGPDSHKLMDAHFLRDDGTGRNVDMTAEHYERCHRVPSASLQS